MNLYSEHWYIAVIFLCITHDRQPIGHPFQRGMRCRSWVQIWPKCYHCNCCALCTIVPCITAIYRESVVFWVIIDGYLRDSYTIWYNMDNSRHCSITHTHTAHPDAPTRASHRGFLFLSFTLSPMLCLWDRCAIYTASCKFEPQYIASSIYTTQHISATQVTTSESSSNIGTLFGPNTKCVSRHAFQNTEFGPHLAQINWIFFNVGSKYFGVFMGAYLDVGQNTVNESYRHGN